MNKKLSFVVAGAAILLLVVIAVTKRPAPSAPAASAEETYVPRQDAAALVASEPSYDFGTVSMANGLVRHEFKIKNEGSNPLTISELYTSCMCTNAIFKRAGKEKGPFGMPGHGFVPKLGETLAPGEEAIIEVVFDPAAHGPAGVGPIQRVVSLNTEAGSNELGIRALVTP